MSDLFGKKGRAWLGELELPIEERKTLDSGLRQIDFLDAELDLARQAEHAYAQTVRNRQAANAIKAGASATPGRASQQPTKGKAARQTTSP